MLKKREPLQFNLLPEIISEKLPMNKSFGSYFSLEIPGNSQNIYYPGAKRLNTGRNALEYLVKILPIKKIYLPYMSCDALFTPLKRQKIPYEFYEIDSNFNPIFDFSCIKQNTFFLYINYYGIKSTTVKYLATRVSNLIVDNSQAFFCKPEKSVPTFYSLRKFFGVSDGALLLNVPQNIPLNRDNSAHRMGYLIKRVENEVEFAFEEYQQVEEELDQVELLEMSDLTQKIYTSIDFKTHLKARNSNFKFLNRRFREVNMLKIDEYEGPLAYPLWIPKGAEVRNKLRKERIYLPTYWPNVLNMVGNQTQEYKLSKNILPIPVDLRYTHEDLEFIAKKIISLL